MLRNILAVVVVGVLWAVFWQGTDAAMRHMLYQPWGAVAPLTTVGLLLLAVSVVISVVAGALCVEMGGCTLVLVLGVVGLALGIAAQAEALHFLPLWFHAAFLLLLVPATLLGTRWPRGAA